jgi:hypothetical protein
VSQTVGNSPSKTNIALAGLHLLRPRAREIELTPQGKQIVTAIVNRFSRVNDITGNNLSWS